MHETLRMVKVENLYQNPRNPRKALGNLEELSDSIKARGVLQPLRVVPDPAHGPDAFMVLAGHRRAAAAKLAGLSEVPCTVAEASDEIEQIADMLTENTQRSGLTFAESAAGFQLMFDGMGGNIADVAKRTGFSSTTVRNKMKLASLDRSKVTAAEDRGVTLGQLQAIADLKDPAARDKVLNAAGTNDYYSALKDAQKEESLKEEWAKTEALVNVFAKKVNYVPVNTVLYETFKSPRKKVKVPDDAAPIDGSVEEGKVRYYYTTSITTYWSRMDIYRDKTSKDEAIQKEEADKSEAMNMAREVANAMNRKHQELRRDFLKKVPKRALKAQADTIAATLVNVIAEEAGGYRYGTWSGMQNLMSYLNGGTVSIDKAKEMLTDTAKDNVALAQLYCLAANCDKQNALGYAEYNYQGGGINYKENPALDQFYDILVKLGYSMSTEEEEMKNGTHPIFTDPASLEKEPAEGAPAEDPQESAPVTAKPEETSGEAAAEAATAGNGMDASQDTSDVPQGDFVQAQTAPSDDRPDAVLPQDVAVGQQDKAAAEACVGSSAETSSENDLTIGEKLLREFLREDLLKPHKDRIYVSAVYTYVQDAGERIRLLQKLSCDGVTVTEEGVDYLGCAFFWETVDQTLAKMNEEDTILDHTVDDGWAVMEGSEDFRFYDSSVYPPGRFEWLSIFPAQFDAPVQEVKAPADDLYADIAEPAPGDDACDGGDFTTESQSFSLDDSGQDWSYDD